MAGKAVLVTSQGRGQALREKRPMALELFTHGSGCLRGESWSAAHFLSLFNDRI